MGVSTRKVIRMTFLDDAGMNYTITIPDPRDNLTAQDILDVMDLILQKNVIQTQNGNLTTKVDARIIETTTNDLYDPGA